MIEEISSKYLENSGFSKEVLSPLEAQREQLVKITLSPLTDLIIAGRGAEVFQTATQLGVLKQLVAHVKSQFLNEELPHGTANYLPDKYCFLEFLLMTGDDSLFQNLFFNENQVNINLALTAEQEIKLLMAYANSGKEQLVWEKLSAKEYFADNYFELLLKLADSTKTPNLIKRIFSLMKIKGLELFSDDQIKILLADQSTFGEAFALLKQELGPLDQTKNPIDRSRFISIIVHSLTTFNMAELWQMVWQVTQTEMDHDDYEVCFLFLNHLVLILDEDSSLREQFILWMTTDKWYEDEVKLHAFVRIYLSRKYADLDQIFENGLQTMIENSSLFAAAKHVEIWAKLAAQFGFQHPFVMRIFNLFKKDTGVFNQEAKESLIKLLNPLFGEGMFAELEEVIKAKTSHIQVENFIENAYAFLTRKGMSYNRLEIDSTIGDSKKDDSIWRLESLAEVKPLLNKYLEQIKQLIMDKPEFFRRLFQIGLDNFGLLNDSLLKIFTEKNLAFKMKKSGSALYIMTGRNLGIIVNEIPPQALKIWEQVSQTAIPVAPLLKTEPRFSGENVLTHSGFREDRQLQRAYSRFCGLSLPEYLAKYHDRATFLSIQSELDQIKTSVKDMGFAHGHPHLHNFTIEFWDKEFVTKQASSGIGINQLIPRKDGILSFDPAVMEQDPQRWIRVIRLIDWDSAVSTVS